jgi:hypothetical protein
LKHAYHGIRLSRRCFILVFWSEPTWAELKTRYDGRVEFQWKIALMDPSGLPTFAGAGAMVLSAQRNDDAFAIHAQHRLVRSQLWPEVARAELLWPKRPRTLVSLMIAFVLALAHAALARGEKR